MRALCIKLVPVMLYISIFEYQKFYLNIQLFEYIKYSFVPNFKYTYIFTYLCSLTMERLIILTIVTIMMKP